MHLFVGSQLESQKVKFDKVSLIIPEIRVIIKFVISKSLECR